jgi:hypothetical protein
MARRELSIFVSGRSEHDWRVVSKLGEYGPFASRQEASEVALRQANTHQPARVLVQNARGTYESLLEPAIQLTASVAQPSWA